MNIAGIDFSIKGRLKKEAVKNGTWLYLLQMFNTVVPLLTLPYITRIIGANQYGVFSIAINIIGYYQVFVEYGFGMSATRKVALLDNKSEKINRIFTTVLISRCFLLAICFILTAGYVAFNRNEILQCLCLLILMIMLFGNCIQLNWLFQGMQQMQYISIISIVSRIISVSLIFTLVKTSEDLLIYCLLYSVSPFISGILGIIIAKRTFHIRLIKIKWCDVWEELRSGWYVFTTQISSKVFGVIGITFMGIFASNTEVGIYSAIQKIPNIMMMAWVPISQVVYPISSKKMEVSFKDGCDFVRRIQHLFLPIWIVNTFLDYFFVG